MSDKATILIVDDADVNVILLEDILENLGYDVLSAGSAKEAADILNRQLPQLVLLDIMMPDVDGYEFCKTLKDSPRTRQIPVIFVSAAESDDERERAFAIGGVDFIRKPYDVTEIKTRISTHLNIYNLRKRLEENNRKLNHVLSEQNRKIIEEKKRILKNITALSNDSGNDSVAKNSRTLAMGLNFTDKYEDKISVAFVEGVEIAGSIRGVDPAVFNIFFSKDDDNKSVRAGSDVINHFREKWDGSGKPDGLCGEDIPLAARVVAITDAFDSLIKSGLKKEDAIGRLKDESGKSFDPYILDLFIKLENRMR